MTGKVSRAGFVAASMFLLSFAATYSYVQYAESTNLADSAEKGVLIIPFVMPWILIVHDARFTQPVLPLLLFLSASLNSILVYFFFGGLAALFRAWSKPRG